MLHWPFLSLWFQPAAVVVFTLMSLNVRAEHQFVIKLPSDYDTAPLPVLNPTLSFWINSPDANPLAKEGSEGEVTLDADVCIIGSGISGVSAAYHLAKAAASDLSEQQLKVVILEARDFCSGATGRNGGHLTPFVFRQFKKHAETFGVDEALRAVSLEQHTAAEIVEIVKTNGLESVVDLVEGGHIDLMLSAAKFTDMTADYESAKEAGANLSAVKWLDKDEVEAKYGTSNPAVQVPGHNLWPLKFVTEVYKLAASSPQISLKLHTNTPVTSVAPSAPNDTRRWNVITPRGSVKCSYVLHTTNAYASHLLPYLSGPTGIVPTRGQVIAVRADATTEKLSKSSWSSQSEIEGLEYWFPRPVEDSEKYPLVILGGGREAAKSLELYKVDDSVVSPVVGKALRKYLPSVFPGLYEEGKEPEMEWTGIMGYTASEDPFVGPVVDPTQPGSRNIFKGQYISAGFSGHGMPRAFACGDAVAQMIAADLAGKPFTPPEWFPLHYMPQAE